jgi:hypothetical protein
VRYNTALVLDTDSVFHGVDRIADVPAGNDEIARYRWDELRFSVSWKAYCFRDAYERDTWREHRDDLTLDVILDRLIDDLRARDRVSGDVARDAALGQLLIDEYVAFPLSTGSSTS